MSQDKDMGSYSQGDDTQENIIGPEQERIMFDEEEKKENKNKQSKFNNISSSKDRFNSTK
jgi:hypothetical protein